MSEPGAQGQPTEEELQAYLAQLRDAPVTDVVAQTVSVLINAAQVKLGRPDARVLIDVVAAVRDTAADQLDERLVKELDNALEQLRLAQVQAEQEAGAATPPGEGQAAEAPADPDAGGGGAGSKLWTPGQP